MAIIKSKDGFWTNNSPVDPRKNGKKISPTDPWKSGKLPQITAGARELWQKREERASSEEEKRSLQSFS